MMAIERGIDGNGITAREVIRYSGEDIALGLRRKATRLNQASSIDGGLLGARVQDIEEDCRNVLAASGEPPYETDSLQAGAALILRHISLMRASITQGNAVEAARWALEVGCLHTEAHIKESWEEYALRGQKSTIAFDTASNAANRERRHGAKKIRIEWQALADDIWARHPELSKSSVAVRIAAVSVGKSGTIRRSIVQK